MSYEDGWSAINLEMPSRVPRTEYSADTHWDLIRKVTGLKVNSTSTAELQKSASGTFIKAWNYDFNWNILINSDELDACRTRMGHAVYEADGVDMDREVSCPFSEVDEVLSFEPQSVYGTPDHSFLVERFNKDYRNRCHLAPDTVNMTGIYITCISGLLEIFGWDMMLMAMGMDAAGFGDVARRYVRWIQPYFNALADCDAPVVMVHDDIVWTSGPFVHPDWYRSFVFPHYKTLLAPLREAGKRIMYTSDGDFSVFIDDVAKAGVHGFVMEPTTDMATIAQRYGQTHVFVGNADTRILLGGTKDQIYNEVKRCMDIGKDCPGYFMAVGNHIPANTPVENALFYNEIYKELSRR